MQHDKIRSHFPIGSKWLHHAVDIRRGADAIFTHDIIITSYMTCEDTDYITAQEFPHHPTRKGTWVLDVDNIMDHVERGKLIRID